MKTYTVYVLYQGRKTPIKSFKSRDAAERFIERRERAGGIGGFNGVAVVEVRHAVGMPYAR